jgi:hypothetical protein
MPQWTQLLLSRCLEKRITRLLSERVIAVVVIIVTCANYVQQWQGGEGGRLELLMAFD